MAKKWGGDGEDLSPKGKNGSFTNGQCSRRGNSVSNLRVDYICLTKMHDIVLGFQVAFNVFI